MSIVLFGAPGAGKGTQSALLVSKMNMVQISTGDLLRSAIKNATDLGKKAQVFVDRGELVPDDLVISLVDEFLSQNTGKNFIFDGFPRTVAQADALNQILKHRNLSISRAIFLEVPRDEIVSRLTGRRICSSCGSVFHIVNKPSIVEGKCDVCGSMLIQRADDQKEVIEKRLSTYESSTVPLKHYFKQEGKYFEINGNLDTESVFYKIKELV